ncbi:hypothetical protein [Streptomyces sp. NPDC005407]|uniref:hypothetical protein n=1 Tax=Streptomyces sp. NPDC005407 TaxID=3155340 RepID=UPI002D537947|nr:hypothetical protein [Streptomyces sp.]
MQIAESLCVGTELSGIPLQVTPRNCSPQDSSVLYMLNQFGASLGIAIVALPMQNAGAGAPSPASITPTWPSSWRCSS